MVDEAAFHRIRVVTEGHSCVFAKAILSGAVGCHHSDHHHLAERETVSCADEASCVRCASWHQLLMHKAAFALHHIHESEPLTHAQEMRLQCGGLRALQQALDGSEETGIDVAALIDSALIRYGTMDDFPYDSIVQGISAYALRKRHG